MAIQSIYTSVSNAKIDPCLKGCTVKSEPIPLLRNNFLSEYRTELDKARVRKNLGIADDQSLLWGNILGDIESSEILVDFIKKEWEYKYREMSAEEVEELEDINTVKEAIDYSLYFISRYEANDEEIAALRLEFELVKVHVEQFQNNIKDNIDKLNKDSNNFYQDIATILSDVTRINLELSNLNLAIETIDVDKNISTWISNHIGSSLRLEKDLEGNDIFEVRISEEENNIITSKEDGLYAEEIVYKSGLSETTTSPVLDDIKVSELQGKTLSQVIDYILFPASVPIPIKPYITVSDSLSNSTVKINSPAKYWTNNWIYNKMDGGDIIGEAIESIKYDGQEWLENFYDKAGKYIYTVTVNYGQGEELLNNRNEPSGQFVPAGSTSATKTITVACPWYMGDSLENVKEMPLLIPFDTNSGNITFKSKGNTTIKIPGTNSNISLLVKAGTFVPIVDTSWDKTIKEEINGYTYTVWTKKDTYAVDAEHQINFTPIE